MIAKSIQEDVSDSSSVKKKKIIRTSSKSSDVKSYKEHLSEKRVCAEKRVYPLVHAILSAWKSEFRSPENIAASTGMIKISSRKIVASIRKLGIKMSHITDQSIINAVLSSKELVSDFGFWMCVVNPVSPDWIFVRLPSLETPIIRADVSVGRNTQTTDIAVTISQENLR